MKTTADFLDELRRHFDVPSDNKLALKMGWERQQVSKYRVKKHAFDDRTAVKVAAVLGIEPDHVLACMAAQRAIPESRSAWERIAAKVAACFVLGIALSGAPAPGRAAFDINSSAGQTRPAPVQSIHMQQRRRRWNGTAGRWKQAYKALSRWFATLALTLGLAACASGTPWTRADITREAAYQAALTVDCAQTRYGASHPDQFSEGNPLLPEHPSKGRINATCLGSGIGHWFISNWLAAGARYAWQGITIGVELWAIDVNRMAGVKIEF